MRKTIYMDNNATTSVAPEVVDAMLPFLKQQFFNPSSMYEAARGPAAAIAEARNSVATLLGGVSDDEVVFTSGATEGNNSVLFGSVRANPRRRHVVTTAVEHPSVREVCLELKRQGLEVTWVGVNSQGEIDLEAFVRALRPDTLLVSVMHANNETGVIFPLEELARLTKETDEAILFHTDATQSVGKLDVNLKTTFSQIDMLSLSGHKLHGPKGVGALFTRRGTPCRPLLYGGHQERGWRAGTENVAAIYGLGTACALASTARDEETRVAAMRDRLQQSLCDRIPWIEVNGGNAERLPNTLNLACHSIEGEAILYQLDAAGVCASSGSACTSGSLDPSHVLKAMQIPFSAMHGSVRFSLSRYTTDDEIDHLIEVFPPIVERLRCLSPYWDRRNACPAGGKE